MKNIGNFQQLVLISTPIWIDSGTDVLTGPYELKDPNDKS